MSAKVPGDPQIDTDFVSLVMSCVAKVAEAEAKVAEAENAKAAVHDSFMRIQHQLGLGPVKIYVEYMFNEGYSEGYSENLNVALQRIWTCAKQSHTNTSFEDAISKSLKQ